MNHCKHERTVECVHEVHRNEHGFLRMVTHHCMGCDCSHVVFVSSLPVQVLGVWLTPDQFKETIGTELFAKVEA